MPASRRARATTLAPRSWPSRPGLATNTRMGGVARENVKTSPVPGAVLVQLDQHAPAGARVHEGELLAVHPAARRLVQHLVAEPGEPADLGRDVLDLEADVVRALAPLLEVARHA